MIIQFLIYGSTKNQYLTKLVKMKKVDNLKEEKASEVQIYNANFITPNSQGCSFYSVIILRQFVCVSL